MPLASERGRNAGDLTPRAEGALAGSAAGGSGQTMAAALEVVVDRAVGGEEALRLPR